ncbi:MAG: hypothetical protein SWE60_08270 [Thermodesulfobacteriota bacterium]|nr:hypothetical protein [Thermodesulfobacteriota bacterium]
MFSRIETLILIVCAVCVLATSPSVSWAEGRGTPLDTLTKLKQYQPGLHQQNLPPTDVNVRNPGGLVFPLESDPTTDATVPPNINHSIGVPPGYGLIAHLMRQLAPRKEPAGGFPLIDDNSPSEGLDSRNETEGSPDPSADKPSISQELIRRIDESRANLWCIPADQLPEPWYLLDWGDGDGLFSWQWAESCYGDE